MYVHNTLIHFLANRKQFLFVQSAGSRPETGRVSETEGGGGGGMTEGSISLMGNERATDNLTWVHRDYTRKNGKDRRRRRENTKITETNIFKMPARLSVCPSVCSIYPIAIILTGRRKETRKN